MSIAESPLKFFSFSSRIICLLGVIFAGPALAWGLQLAEDPEESDYPPGLLGTYISGEEQIQRIDPDISFDWNNGSPDVRLKGDQFSAEWDGYLLLKSAGDYTFSAYLQGELEILLDDQVVLKATADKPQWVSGPAMDFSFGEMPVHVKYRKTGSAAIVKLFWSSPQFAIEPISTHLLFRETGSPELALLEQGRMEYHAWRCAACHAGASASQPPAAPSLQRIQGALTASWIVDKLTRPAGKHDHMPEFSLNSEQAQDIAAYLLKESQSVPQLKKPSSKKTKEDISKGELLVRSTGCLACHVIDDLGAPGPFGGGELTDIGNKRSAAWLAHWLKSPAQLNSQHRMPQFTFSDSQINQIALYLASLKQESEGTSKSAESAKGASAERGKQLMAEFRCAACHQVPGIESSSLPVLAMAAESSASSCLGEAAASRKPHQPHFSHAPQEAITGWIQQSIRKSTAAEVSEYTRGQDLLNEKNCLACHSRDRHPGSVALAGILAQADSRLAGQSQGLIPPHLTAVGDRLQDEALHKAMAGEQPRRLPWLSVQMPRFQHTPEESKLLQAYLIGHDRLPDPIPDSRLQLAESKLSTSEELLLGRELTGGRAFNCIACHKMGDYEPRNTALGTKGSDLLTVSSRLRPQYFLRWTMSPLRIVPGMEMPSFNQPRAGFPVHDLGDQLSALWRAFGDPTFTAPSNPTVVEQYLTVGPEQSARIVRDVFELKTGRPKEREFIPRPLAVGLPNGHSILFDLDAAAVRAWNYGDFAYQQTEGKSWYWYLAGAPITSQFSSVADLNLRSLKTPDAPLLQPVMNGVRKAFLLNYTTTGAGAQFEYLLHFQLPEETVPVQIQEKWLPMPSTADSSQTGWQRIIQCSNLPEGYQLVLTGQVEKVLLGQPELQVNQQTIPFKAGEQIAVGFPDDKQAAAVTVNYVARVSNRQTQPFADKPEITPPSENIAGTPGFQARRLPISTAIMPTALNWRRNGDLVFTSLKGHVFAASDTNKDGLPDSLQIIEEGLSAPFGILPRGDSLLVVHKPEVIELADTEGDGRVYQRRIVADGWGHSDNYHDWITGFAEDASGHLYVASGSDYSQKGRPQGLALHRGEVMSLGPDRSIRTFATEFRYPIGIATDPEGRIFTSDQQGVQNCFNEINHVMPGRGYGVPALYQEALPEQRAAIQLPHPWTRSVNGIFFIPDQDNLGALSAFRGHGVGCEYNNRFLVRFSLQEVNGELQGACYELTRSVETMSPSDPLLVGPICGAVGPDGNIYVGSLYDSGWLGGQNTGEIVQLKAEEKLPNGIRELRAIPGGFELEFLEPVDTEYLQNPDNYDLSGYTRVWQGDYATPDSGRYRPQFKDIQILKQGQLVRIFVNELKPSFVYDLHLKNRTDLFPVSAYYTMNQVPDSQ